MSTGSVWVRRPIHLNAGCSSKWLLSRRHMFPGSPFCRISTNAAAPVTHHPPFPVIDKCPPATCSCREISTDLDIDHEAPLDGTMAAHAGHVLVCTGKQDWASRIEDDEQGVLAREIKMKMGRNGKFSNPYHNIMVGNASFEPSHKADSSFCSALLLPSFRYLSTISPEDRTIDDFIKGFLLPTKLHSSFDNVTSEAKRNLLRDDTKQSSFLNVRAVNDFVIMICGHGGRDKRCGIIGPLLRSEFIEKLRSAGYNVKQNFAAQDRSTAVKSHNAVVGLISHMGGHKFAGNVIIYTPPTMTDHPLAGIGIWYGRVEPRHVEGIVEETIGNGNVVGELYRGGVGSAGEVLRL